MQWFRIGHNSAKRSRAAHKNHSVTVWEAIAEELGDDPEVHKALQDYHCARVSAKSGCEESDAERLLRKFVVRKLHMSAKSAICFSGGGIRSATFGLGVLQGLAAHSCGRTNDCPRTLLESLDYISTVSGGGYLGAWFSGWAARAPGGVSQVIRELACAPQTAWDPEPITLRRLRRYVNYLNPKIGLFSADTWTLAATVLRNLLLNWLVLLPLLASVLALPRILYKLVNADPSFDPAFLLWCSAALVAASVTYMLVDLPGATNARLSQHKFLFFGLLPLLLASVGFVLYWSWAGLLENEPGPPRFMLYGIGIMAAGVAAGTIIAISKRRPIQPLWILQGTGFAVAAGAIGGFFSWWMTWAFTDPQTDWFYNDRVYTWLSIPSLLGVFSLTQAVLVGFSSTITSEEDREWFARASAWILIAVVCCFSFTGMALMPPVLAHWLPSIHWQAVISVVTGGIASRMGYSTLTAGTEEQQYDESAARLKSALSRALPYVAMSVFLVALLALLATFNEAASATLAGWLKTPPAWSGLQRITDPVAIECILVILLAAPALVLSRFIDANKFSLNAMYRNRLIRTFLGASNDKRHANPFTGFDPNDNVAMSHLPAKPLLVVNAALNLVRGEKLAWQQRKAEPFTATRYRVGSCRVGYQSSDVYIGGLMLGSAIAVSGAAANPNMGYASSPLLSMVMMLFNARLGAWAPNPGEAGKRCWKKGGPTFSILPFVNEAFGLTTDGNAWVNLSDGGHFENLGIYEMVLRRCATIIAVDGSADPLFHFDDLGNAIRKIYVDLGITIEFPDGISISKQRLSVSRHCAIGRIRYSAVDGPGTPDGTLIYVKSSLTGNEPMDVLNYAAQNPSFPHQSTTDQWFNESQFEAYRRLGYHVIEEIFRFKDDTVSLPDFQTLAERYTVGRAAEAMAAGD